MAIDKDYYAILGVHPTAEIAVIEAIFCFETAFGQASGVLRLLPREEDEENPKAWTLVTALNEMIASQSVNDATIFVDPTDNGIRIYGKWKNSYDFGITKELFDIYNNIAGYIKKIN